MGSDLFAVVDGWMDRRVAVEINWTGPVPSDLSVSAGHVKFARPDQTDQTRQPMLQCLLAITQTKCHRVAQILPLLSVPGGDEHLIGEGRAHKEAQPSKADNTVSCWQVASMAAAAAVVVQIWPRAWLEIKKGPRGARAGSTADSSNAGSGTNTTRSRLVALDSVPFTRIPGLVARGREG
jgi:hypothetical protein